MLAEEARAREENDARIDAETKKQIHLQCRFCRYRLYDTSGKQTLGCDYVSFTGKLRDRGSGIGDCRSFDPKDRETKEERIKRSREAMRKAEGNRKW